VRPNHQRFLAFGLAVSSVAAALSLLSMAFAFPPASPARPASTPAPAAGGFDLFGALTIGKLPAGGPLQMCAQDGDGVGDGVRQVRCAVPPGGLGPITGPILTPTAPQAPPAPAPEPQVPANANEPGKVPSPAQPAADPGFRYHPPGLLAVRDATAKRGRHEIARSTRQTSSSPSGSKPAVSPP